MFDDSRFWIASTALAVIFLCALVFSAQLNRLALKIVASIGAAFAVVSLIYVAKALISRVLPASVADGTGGAAGSTDSALALGLFTILATIAAGYSFVVVNRFERQRAALDQRVKDAEVSAAGIGEKSVAMDQSLSDAKLSLDLSNKRLRAFLQIYRAIGATDPEESEDAFKNSLDLRLLESLVCRVEWSLFKFDLDELLVVSGTDHRRLAQICQGPVQEFLTSIPNAATAVFPEISEVQLKNLTESVEQFLSRVRA